MEVNDSTEQKTMKKSPLSYSAITSKNSDAQVLILTKLQVELEQRAKIDRNIIISGLAEKMGVELEAAVAAESDLVERHVRTLGIEPSKKKKKARLRKKNVAPDPSRPSQLLVEFEDCQTATTVITNCKKLASVTEFKKVYLNKDRTEVERRREACLREERNRLDAALLHEENGLRFGLDESNNKRFYWGIRDSNIVKIFRDNRNH